MTRERSLPTLHVLAIGVDAAGADSVFTRKKHAQLVSDNLADGTSGDIFDEELTNRILQIDTTVLLDAAATYANVANAIKGVIQRSRPVDVFVFYFAGKSASVRGQDGHTDYLLKLSRADSTPLSPTAGSISPRQLQTWLNVIPARNQLVILDAADGAQFLVSFTRLDSLQRVSERRSLNTNLAAVAAAYPQLWSGAGEVSRASSALTPRLIEALGAGEFETVTAHRLLQDLHVRPTPFESTVLRYAEGNDFPLGINYDGDVGEEIKNRVLAQLYAATGDIPEQSFDRSRSDGFSVMVDSVGAEARIRLRIGPASLATEVTVNGRRAVPDTSSLREAESGVFRVSLPLESLSDSLRVTAFGDSGTYARRTVAVSVGSRGLAGASSPAAGAQFARSGKDYALIFATNTYEQWPSLTNPLFDARAIARDLSSIYGFEVRLVENPTRRQIRDSLQAYAERGGPQDQLLVFFAGHGGNDEKRLLDGFVIASDTKSEAEDPDKETAVPYTWLRNRLATATSKHVLLVLDVCYGGSFANPISRSEFRGDPAEPDNPLYRRVDGATLFGRRIEYASRRYLTSGGLVRVPDGLPGQHSPFARALLEALRTHGRDDGILTLAEIHTVIEGIDPEPRAGTFAGDEPGGDFLFVARKP